jgi:hypothetical protein
MEAWVMARAFNGSSDSIDFGTWTQTGQTSYTASLWVYPNSFPATAQFMFEINASAGVAQQVLIDATTGKLGWYINNNHAGPQNFQDPGTNALSLNTWSNLIWGYDTSNIAGNGAFGFINNVSDFTPFDTGSTVAWPSGAHLFVGFDGTVPNRYFNGRIAEVAVWTGITLTSLERAAILAGVRPNAIRPKNLVFWAPLGGIQSPEPDLSGFAKNGTLTGTNPAFGPPVAPFTPRWPQNLFAAPPVFILMPQIVT